MLKRVCEKLWAVTLMALFLLFVPCASTIFVSAILAEEQKPSGIPGHPDARPMTNDEIVQSVLTFIADAEAYLEDPQGACPGPFIAAMVMSARIELLSFAGGSGFAQLSPENQEAIRSVRAAYLLLLEQKTMDRAALLFVEELRKGNDNPCGDDSYSVYEHLDRLSRWAVEYRDELSPERFEEVRLSNLRRWGLSDSEITMVEQKTLEALEVFRKKIEEYNSQ